MQTIYYLFFIAIVIIIFYYVSKTSKFKINADKKIQRETWPYKKKNYFFNQSERKFYHILSDILGDKYLLFSKVRISDLLYLPKHQNNYGNIQVQ